MKIFQSFQWESWQKKEKDKTMEFQLMGIDDFSAATESLMYLLTTVERCISSMIFLNTWIFRDSPVFMPTQYWKKQRKGNLCPFKTEKKFNAKLLFSFLKAAHDK